MIKINQNLADDSQFHSDEAKAQKVNDSRLILPINPDKAQKADDSQLILPINSDKTHKVSIMISYIIYDK